MKKKRTEPGLVRSKQIIELEPLQSNKFSFFMKLHTIEISSCSQNLFTFIQQ